MKQRGFEVAKGWKNKGIKLPRRATTGAAGYDIAAAEDTLVPAFHPGQKPTLIATGLKAYCQPDECYLIFNRSSGPGRGIILANGVGLIDYDYYNNPDNDGHFRVLVFNPLDHDILIKKGDRIAQVVFQKILTVDNDDASGERRSGIGSTNHFKVVYDCDDVLWPLTKVIDDKLNVDYEKHTSFKLQDCLLSEEEKVAFNDEFHNSENFKNMPFYDAVPEIVDIHNLGADIVINSNCFNSDVAKQKRTELKALLPFIRASDMHINVVTPRTNRKTIGQDVLAFVDDSPYNIAPSEALLNIIPKKPWNTTAAAKKVVLERGGEIVKNWKQNLPEIINKHTGKHIIYVKDLATANTIIKQAIKLAKGEANA